MKSKQQIDEIMDSLDGIQRAEPAPFFYTRVIGRLQKQEKTIWEKAGSFLARPVVVFAGLCLILMTNAIILISSPDNSSNSSIANEPIEQLSTDNEFLYAASSGFDYENLDPQ